MMCLGDRREKIDHLHGCSWTLEYYTGGTDVVSKSNGEGGLTQPQIVDHWCVFFLNSVAWPSQERFSFCRRLD